MKSTNVTGTIKASPVEPVVFPCIRKLAQYIDDGERFVFFDEENHALVDPQKDCVAWNEGTGWSWEETEPAPPDDEVTLRIVAGDGSEFPRVTKSIGDFYWLMLSTNTKNAEARSTRYTVRADAFGLKGDNESHHYPYVGMMQDDVSPNLCPLPPNTVTLLTIRNAGTPAERVAVVVEEPKLSDDLAPESYEEAVEKGLPYFVDFRSGCVGVREVASTDKSYQGLHETTPGVVFFRCYATVYDLQEALNNSEYGKTHKKEAIAACRRLNEKPQDAAGRAAMDQQVSGDAGDFGPFVVGNYQVRGLKGGGVTITRRDLPSDVQIPGGFTIDEADQLIDVLTRIVNAAKGVPSV